MENFKADKFCVLSLLSVLFSIFQKISIKSTVHFVHCLLLHTYVHVSTQIWILKQYHVPISNMPIHFGSHLDSLWIPYWGPNDSWKTIFFLKHRNWGFAANHQQKYKWQLESLLWISTVFFAWISKSFFVAWISNSSLLGF